MKLRNSIRPIRLLLLLSGLLALASCRQDETQSLSEYLDYVIENKHIFEAEKEERISRLRNLLGVSNLTPEQEYEINTKLYEEFRKYKLDSAIRYVDLGSADLLAAKADGTENVLRVKAALRDFSRESNLSVITEDGAYYTFNVKYADEPVKLSVEMTDFLHDGEAVNRPNNALEIYMEELGSESPLLVKLIMRSIYKNARREVKHIGCKRFGIQYLLKGIYSHNGLLYFHLQLKNSSNVPFEVDHLTFKIADKKVAKRTAIQEQVIRPLRAHNNVQVIRGKSSERMVFTLPKFTIPDDKHLVVELYEKEGGRHQTFTVENADLVHAEVINELKVK